MLADTHTRAHGYPPGPLELLYSDLTDEPELEPALSRVILDQVAGGSRPATVRISRLGRTVAFGRRDTISPGYPEAIRAARNAGFRSMERVTGGRVAAHSEGTMVLAITTPHADPASGTTMRFRRASELVRDGLGSLGVDARLGIIPGEYCPGEWSINGAGRIKLAGAGQRMIRGAVHLAFVIVAAGADPIREVLDPVHRALGLAWEPATAGSVADLRPGTTPAEVEATLLARLDRVAGLRAGTLDGETLGLARSGSGRFRSPDPDSGNGPAGSV